MHCCGVLRGRLIDGLLCAILHKVCVNIPNTTTSYNIHLLCGKRFLLFACLRWSHWVQCSVFPEYVFGSMTNSTDVVVANLCLRKDNLLVLPAVPADSGLDEHLGKLFCAGSKTLTTAKGRSIVGYVKIQHALKNVQNRCYHMSCTCASSCTLCRGQHTLLWRSRKPVTRHFYLSFVQWSHHK